jgi:hypothetical protein
VSCADAFVTGHSAALNTTMAPVHARARQIAFFIWIGIFDAAQALSSVCLPVHARWTEQADGEGW